MLETNALLEGNSIFRNVYCWLGGNAGNAGVCGRDGLLPGFDVTVHKVCDGLGLCTLDAVVLGIIGALNGNADLDLTDSEIPLADVINMSFSFSAASSATQLWAPSAAISASAIIPVLFVPTLAMSLSGSSSSLRTQSNAAANSVAEEIACVAVIASD